MALGFQISAGTIPGRSHVGFGNLLLGKNNQDAFSLRVFDDCIIATVQDGCSSGAHSEIGASIGGRILLTLIHQSIDTLAAVNSCTEAAEQFEKIRKRLLCKLAQLAELMIQPGCSDDNCKELTHKYCAAKRLLHDCFLFTSFGFLVTPRKTIVFSIGDGVFAINGELKREGPFPYNAPPYVAYALLPSVFNYDADLLKFKIHAVIPTSLVESLLIATDGLIELIDNNTATLPGTNRSVGHISQLWSDDRFFDDSEHNLITPWLRQVNSEVVKTNREARLVRSAGLLSDDTTLIAIRKKN